MSLQIRRGTAAEVATITPDLAEPIYVTDTLALVIGDGTTQGGHIISANLEDLDISKITESGHSVTILNDKNSTGTIRLANLVNSNSLTVSPDNTAVVGPMSVSTTATVATLKFGDGTTMTTAPVNEANQALNTNSNVSFNSVVVSTTATLATLKFGDGTTMTTAPTSEANQSLNTNSNVTFNSVSISTTASVGTELSIGAGTYRMLLGQSGSGFDNQFYITGNAQVNDRLYFDQFNLVQINAGNQLQVESTATFNGPVAVNNTLTVSSNATANSMVTQDLVSSGGFPLNDSGMALIRVSNTQTPALVASNYTAGLLPEVVVRGYGQNRPGGASTTIGAAGVVVESSRGTHTAPTVPAVGDVIASFSAGSYDGTRWSSDMNIYPAQIIATAAETWAGNATTTTNAGSRLEMWVQPPAVQLNTTSRFRPMRHVWTAGNVGTGTPPILNIHEGSGQDGAPTLTPASGTGSFGTGSGRVNFVKTNTVQQIFGVPTEDTTADNPSLKGTNSISFITGRRNGVVGRRNKLLNGDTVGQISFAGQTADNSPGQGAGTAYMYVSAAEDFSPTATGSAMSFGTSNMGTNAGAVLRLRLNSDQNTYNSNGHDFLDNASGSIASLNTSTAQFFVPVTFPVYTVASKPTTGAVGQQICISDSASGSNPNGMMAFWDTTNGRWSYVHDNAAV